MAQRLIDTYTGSTVVVDDELAASLGSQYIPEDEYEAPAPKGRRGRGRTAAKAAPAEGTEQPADPDESEDAGNKEPAGDTE